MSVSTTGKILFGLLVALVLLEGPKFLQEPVTLGLVSEAHAVVGRPLTPISVAGVARRSARRTVRRCAAGIYHC